jgi:hypothetical protein
MSNDTVMVLTSKSIETMLQEGGAGQWKANENSIRRCRWLVAVRNRHSDWSQGQEEHGAAFVVGRVTGIKPAPKGNGRVVITFDRYARVNIPNVWPADHRNPVAYASLADLNIDPEALEWREFGDVMAPAASATSQSPTATAIEEARMMIARAFSIQPSSVKISIDV